MANGPALAGLGKHGGRMRNTLANVLSKNKIDYQNPGGAQALPSLDPASEANYYQQLGNLYAQYQTTLSGLKLQRVGLRAGFAANRAGIRAQKVEELAGVENQAIERGILGSSAELQQRTGVRAAAAANIAAERNALTQGIAQTRLAAQQAGIDYQQGATALEAQKLAQQQQLLAQQLEQNLIISGQEAQMDAMRAIYEAIAGNIAGGGGGRQGGRGGRLRRALGGAGTVAPDVFVSGATSGGAARTDRFRLPYGGY